MILRSKAPLRISFGGGGTDISPYFETHGGVVISSAIDKYAYCTLETRNDNVILINSLDLDITENIAADCISLYNGKLDLIKAAINRIRLKNGCELLLHCDTPPGSGLGTSSAVVVTVVGALGLYQNMPLTTYEIAELAYQIEREDLGIKGGKQDQYAATFGGFNFIEFYRDTTVVNPLRLADYTLNELEYRLVLCHTGSIRLSDGIIEDQVKGFTSGKEDVIEALHQTKKLAISIKNALLLGKINDLGELLHEAWQKKLKFSTKISNVQINELYEIAKNNGAIGGKLLGAGGGGHMLFLSAHNMKHKLIESLTKVGGRVIDFAFDNHGLQTWKVLD